MKIIFFGTPNFSAQIFSYLYKQGLNIVAVVTQPDKPKGRSKKLQPSALKECVQEIAPNLPIYQPQKASSKESIEELQKYQPDLFVVAAFGQILRQALLDVPLLDSINVHTSLLPKYRGAAPIQRALINGEDESGITIMKMVLALDAGDILAKGHMKIPEDMTYGELEEKLAEIGGPLLLQVLKAYQENAVKAIAQKEEDATYAPKIEPEECELDLKTSAIDMHNRIRGLSPTPGAWVWIEMAGIKKKLKIFRSKVHHILPPHQTLTVPCKEGFLELLDVQLEGKKRMRIQDFLRGVHEKIIFFN